MNLHFLIDFIPLRKACILIMLCSLGACQQQDNSYDLNAAFYENASNMSVNYQVISNTADLSCKQSEETSDCYASTLGLSFTEPLPNNGWYILFSHLSPIQKVSSKHFAIERINGDLHKMTPLTSIDANTQYNIELVSQFWAVSSSDVLPNYFFVFGDNKTALIKATAEIVGDAHDLPIRPHAGSFDAAEQIKRVASDNSQREDARTRFDRNQSIHTTKASKEEIRQRIIPKIQSIESTGGVLDSANGFTLQVRKNGDLVNTQYISLADSLLTLSTSSDALKLTVTIDETTTALGEQAYQIDVTDEGVSIDAKDDSGAFYALLSLNQLIDAQQTLPKGVYKDAPKFLFRGVHLDVGRNFRSVKFVKSLIQQMAYLKLNKLHLHLADDEGWRLAIDGLDELTSIGAFRCFDMSERECLLPQLGSGPDRSSSANGFYSRDEYISLLQYAQQHHVEIIPSLDMPGHSRAAVKAMEARFYNKMAKGDSDAATEYLLTDFDDTTVYSSVQHYNDNTINPCMSSTYRFVSKVLSELVDMHNAANVKLHRYHIGADETAGAWHKSPICKAYIAQNNDLESVEDLSAYFITRVAKRVEEKGVIAGGWSDGMRGVDKTGLAPMQVNVWDGLMWGGHQAAYDFAQQGWRAVLSFPDVLYFDFPYAVDPNEPGYYWATRATDSYKVFQFTPDYPAQNSRLWIDRMGQAMKQEGLELPTIVSAGKVEGIQAHLWSEVVRHDKVAQYMYFPRLLSVAENAWAQKAWQQNIPKQTTEQWLLNINKDWAIYSSVLSTKALPRLAKQGINFRLPTPGAKLIDNAWHVNHLYAGVQLQFKTDTSSWQDYSSPIDDNVSGLEVRAKIFDTQRVSKSLNLPIATPPRGGKE